jgi:hypothetical protein
MAALKHALNQLNWTYVVNQAEQFEYRVKVSFTFLGHGEKVDVKIGSEGKVELTSTCSAIFPGCGKNRRNIEGILEHMNIYFDENQQA